MINIAPKTKLFTTSLLSMYDFFARNYRDVVIEDGLEDVDAKVFAAFTDPKVMEEMLAEGYGGMMLPNHPEIDEWVVNTSEERGVMRNKVEYVLIIITHQDTAWLTLHSSQVTL